MKMFAKLTIYIFFILSSLSIADSAWADDDYDIGSPTLQEIWVDPVHGLDKPGRGTTRALALKSVKQAWAFIPPNDTLNNTGYKIWLAPGVYSADDVPSEFQSVWGTFDYPVIFQAADDTGSVIFPSVDVSICNYFYLIGITVIANQSSYVTSFRACDHILLRNCTFIAADTSTIDTASFGASFYRCQYTYIERSKITFSSGNAIDMFATQYGHIKNCWIHDCGAHGISMRGGSGYCTIEENTLNNLGKGGITFASRDTSSGLDNMIIPWVHFEVYDVKCFNNIIHHTQEAGLNCSGGFNILFAFNTLYQTGINNSLVIINLGRRACSVDREICQQLIDSGAWGTWYTDLADSDSAPIPNKNIFIYNNIFYNTLDSATADSHFSISGPVTALAYNAACPRPALADDNLKIRGNIVWNGNANDLGVTPTSGCEASNPSCNQTQLYSDNLINTAQPKFVNASLGNFHPFRGSIVFTIAKTFPIPDFSWTGLPAKPKEPAGKTSNTISFDRDSNRRNLNFPIAGAFDISTSFVEDLNNLQSDILLLQNFPNPAHDMTMIEFQLRNRAHVILEVYDILGAKMATLISESQDAGDHYANYNTSALAAGKYFYRISTENMTMTKQMTVAR